MPHAEADLLHKPATTLPPDPPTAPPMVPHPGPQVRWPKNPPHLTRPWSIAETPAAACRGPWPKMVFQPCDSSEQDCAHCLVWMSSTTLYRHPKAPCKPGMKLSLRHAQSPTSSETSLNEGAPETHSAGFHPIAPNGPLSPNQPQPPISPSFPASAERRHGTACASTPPRANTLSRTATPCPCAAGQDHFRENSSVGALGRTVRKLTNPQHFGRKARKSPSRGPYLSAWSWRSYLSRLDTP